MFFIDVTCVCVRVALYLPGKVNKQLIFYVSTYLNWNAFMLRSVYLVMQYYTIKNVTIITHVLLVEYVVIIRAAYTGKVLCKLCMYIV